MNNTQSQYQKVNPVLLLLGTIICALLLFIGFLIMVQKPSEKGSGKEPRIVAGPGQTVKREEVPRPAKPPQPVDSERVSSALKVGKTYEMVIKGTTESEGTSKSWGTKTVVYIQWVFECAVDRIVEINDGNKIVEIRNFKTVRSVRVDSKIKDISFDFGLPGDLILGFLSTFDPNSFLLFETVAPFAKELSKTLVQSQLDENAKVLGSVDSLTGKKVRITFENAKGVTQIEPINCSLRDDERDFLMATAVLGDCFIMPDLKGKVGSKWNVAGQNLAGLIDPSLRGQTEGSVTIERMEDSKSEGRSLAILKITEGFIKIDSTTPENYNIGRFVPRGTMVFDLDDQFVRSADLTGDISIENCSRDHILFETRFDAKPKLKINYSCKMK
jgi:hypothetical protein